MNKIKANFEGQTVFIGMDVHKNSWNLGIQLNDIFVRNVHQKPNPQMMVDYLHTNFPGAIYKAAYEAGKFWFLDTAAVNRLRSRMPGCKPCRHSKIAKRHFAKNRSTRCQKHFTSPSKWFSSGDSYP